MILLGIYTKNKITAATAAVQMASGHVEKDVLGMVGGDVFAVTAAALAEIQTVRVRGLRIFTNDDKLIQFLTPPIRVLPTTQTQVRTRIPAKGGMITEVADIPTGGDPNQWEILYALFGIGGRWSVKRADNLPGTEAMIHEFTQSGGLTESTGAGVLGCYRRLDTGVWADTRDARR